MITIAPEKYAIDLEYCLSEQLHIFLPSFSHLCLFEEALWILETWFHRPFIHSAINHDHEVGIDNSLFIAGFDIGRKGLWILAFGQAKS